MRGTFWKLYRNNENLCKHWNNNEMLLLYMTAIKLYRKAYVQIEIKLQNVQAGNTERETYLW